MKPSLFHTVGVGLLGLMVALVGYEAYNAYMIGHTYYYDMLASSNNRGIIFWMFVGAGIPLSTLFFNKSFSFKPFSLSLALGLLISGYAHASLKGGMVGNGRFLYTFNMLFLIALIAIFVLGLYCVGAKIYHYIVKQKIQYWYDMMLAFGIGLAAFALLNYILILTSLFYPVLARAQLVGMIYLIRSSHTELKEANSIISGVTNIFHTNSYRKRIFGILLLLSIVYLYIGFHLAFIPYSTAWDANHAYMYFPKVWADNHGIFLKSGPQGGANLWMSYIAYWFSLMRPLSPGFTLAPDTVAVVMNFISGPLSLLFGLGALRKVIDYFKPATTDKNNIVHYLPFALGWAYFLLWLMSGMGAFLVFVDNKTDLGVMSLSMIAMLSGFIFLQYVGNPGEHTPKETTYINNMSLYAIISGLFFALATIAKPTAFQDVLLFGLLMIGLWVGMLGALGGFLFILGILGRAETMSVVFYISKSLGTKLLGLGGLGMVGQALLVFKNKSRHFLRPLLVWTGTIIATLLLLKGPYLLYTQYNNDTLTPSNFAKALLLGSTQSGNKSSQQSEKKSLHRAFVADTGDGVSVSSGYVLPVAFEPTIKPLSCSLSAAGLTQESLYSGMSVVQGGGLTEDLGRYIGFGQRTFSVSSSRSREENKSYGNVRLGYPLLRLFFSKSGCYGNDATAKILCKNTDLINQVQINKIQELYTQASDGSRGKNMLSGVLEFYAMSEKETDPVKKESIIKDAQKTLNDYMQSNSIFVTKDANNKIQISIPYAYLTPLNVIFNRSLQNLSSYYTDIGFIWIISLLLLVIGVVYCAIQKDYKLTVLHIITLFGWIVRWFIASGIIWYAVGLIAWTIFSNVLFISSLVSHQHKDKSFGRVGQRVVGVIVFILFVQTIFNLVRIASQGGSGPFTRYKGSTAKENVFQFDQNGISQREVIKNGYRASDVFNLQFGSYNAFLQHVRDRKDEDGVLVAGSYIQYFLHNQNYLFGDGLLTEFWKRGSEGDTCTLALRLKDKKIKYLVIDPNIGTVVMGGGNSTLFDRFLAKVDSKTNTIVSHGTMTMLSKMVQEGYLKLINSNSMAAKYSYTLSDAELLQVIQAIPDTNVSQALLKSFQSEPVLFKAKLAIPRFFPEESNNYFILIGTILQKRLSEGKGLGDVADMIGKVIDEKKLNEVAVKILQKTMDSQSMAKLNKDLTEDEKVALGYYLSLVQMQQSGKIQEFQNMLSSLLQQSLGGGSQLMTFELTI